MLSEKTVKISRINIKKISKYQNIKKTESTEKISVDEVRAAIAKMKTGKAAGPSGIGAEMLKATGEDGVAWVADLCNAVVKEGWMSTDWKKSWMVRVFKGKGDALECGSYRGIKLLDQALKVLERVIEEKVRSRVKIDDMQFGFTRGKGTTDAIFIIRQVHEKYMAKKKDLWMTFVDMEKPLIGCRGRFCGGR